jgi:hypothetical protein
LRGAGRERPDESYKMARGPIRVRYLFLKGGDLRQSRGWGPWVDDVQGYGCGGDGPRNG